MDTPLDLSDWSLDIIEDFLIKGYYETEYFDFKQDLPNKMNEEDKERLKKTCCAFANSQGGFLIFGIADKGKDEKKSLTVEQRLKGLERSLDFPEHFGVYPQNCKQSVIWKFRNPPIELESGKVIHIVHILRSWEAPHCFETRHRDLCFPKRTNKGNENMSFEEIRMNFLQFYEKRLKLGLLQAELLNIVAIAEDILVIAQKNTLQSTLHTFGLDVIESVIADTYTIFAEDKSLYIALQGLRTNCRLVNNKIAQFNFVASRDLVDTVRISVYNVHNATLMEICPKIIDQAIRAVNGLEKFKKG